MSTRQLRVASLLLPGLPSLLAVGLLAGPVAHASTINVSLVGIPAMSPEAGVIDQARIYWENRIVSGEIFNVTVQTAPLGPTGPLGRASGYTSSTGTTDANGRLTGTPTGGTIDINSDIPNFFVDGSPADNLEYDVQGSPTFFQASGAVLSPAFGNNDLLSLLIHEFGHTLGFSSSFAGLAAGIFPSADNGRSIYQFASNPTLGDRFVDYLALTAPNSTTWGAVYMPNIGTGPNSEGESAAGEAGSVGNFPSHLDARALAQPPSAALFPQDVMNPALSPSERRLISFADLDILADAYGYTVVPEPGTLSLALLGVLGLAAAGRRRTGPQERSSTRRS